MNPHAPLPGHAGTTGDLLPATGGRARVAVQVDGMVVVEHEVVVPLDHTDSTRGQITVFAREAWEGNRPDLPWLLYLHGGPCHESTRPTWSPANPGWLGRTLRDYRVVLLDARGTGRSTPVGSLAGSAEETAERLTLYRADAVVRDAELVRRVVCGDRPWSVLGESAGGFALLTYLSLAPEGVAEALFAGGLPPVGFPPDEVYQATHEGMIDRSERYYARYPGDRERVTRLHARLAEQEVRLPGGDRLTGRRLRQLGILLGTTGGEERLHYLLERDPASAGFLHDVAAATPWSARDPLHTVLHESCWADGYATSWSAQRTLPAEFDADPTLWTGEHVYPWMLDADDGYPGLSPWRETAELLAAHVWPRLYDEQRLRSCTVPCAAVIYADDAYVPPAFSHNTAQLIPTMRTWTNTGHRHDGLDVDGAPILDQLFTLARDGNRRN